MLKRFAIVAFAYLAACCVAGLVINCELLGWKWLVEGERLSDIEASVESIGALLLLSLMMGAYVASFALIPFVVVLPVMMRFGRTSRLWAAVAGSAVGLVFPIKDVVSWHIWGGGPEVWIGNTLLFAAVLAGAGAAAALTFRGIAARSLGLSIVNAKS